MHAARHHVAHRRVVGAAFGNGADRDVAIGDDADEATAGLRTSDALDDRHESDVLLLHQRAASETGVSGDTERGFFDMISEIFIVVLVAEMRGTSRGPDADTTRQVTCRDMTKAN